ncbi:MAG: glycosyltransferase family 2 protein [Oscillospiraceae bacterium]|nr:glycosyltransferase family 2 protein [Oscillospiraceae bacterium]
MVGILLAARNSEKYLQEQLDSIANQTYADWRLFIRDNLSSDSTAEILSEFSQNHPAVVVESCNALCAKGSFFDLMQRAEHCDYYMFCDHDDVWNADKIETMLAAMVRAENSYGSVPIVVHSDLAVTDQNLNVISQSYFKHQKIRPNKNRLNNYLYQNTVTGCASMINNSMRDLSLLSDTDGVIMHDWWIAMTASVFGRIVTVPQSTVFYRQHGDNQVGARNRNLRSYIKFVWNQVTKAVKSGYPLKPDTVRQAERFRSVYKDRLPQEQLKIIDSYLALQNAGRIKRLRIILKHGFLVNGPKRITAQIAAAVLLGRPKSQLV